MEREANLTEALEHIDPAELDYGGWLRVGMGLKEAGYPVSVWDGWSRRDPARYHSGECARKWESFHGSAAPVTAGTIVRMARSRGWRPARAGGRVLGWDGAAGGGSSPAAEEEEWRPAEQLIAYLEALFEAGDNVGYVTRSYEKDGRYLPDRGCWDRTAGKLIAELSRCGDDVGKVLGDYNPEAGAWIRINPLDGRGCRNENVTDFRYALVESDTIPVERQRAVIRALELPVAALVHSGGKSLHAIVRIEADSAEEYRRRVDFLYEVCRKNGLEPDRQNRNPSRLSRMPGVTRKGKRQFLAAVNTGKASWDEWREWIEAASDGLPDPEGDLAGEPPELAPALIGNVLRRGHKMLLAGPSKAGKSFALIELAVCIAEGLDWLGFRCAQGRVLYVNLELDRASCLHRFRAVRQAMGAPAGHSVDVWNLRGHAVPMDALAPKLIRRAMRKDYIAVIIDPIYKVITGDENSAEQMAKFCNQFDKVCTELGCAVIYCHHHSKGVQGGKRSMDRASGSGVFARDPDALLDLIELPVGEAVRSGAPEGATAWRVEGTLREFPRFAPISLWFDYPIHRLDRTGVLEDIDPEGGSPGWQRKKSAPPVQVIDELSSAFGYCDEDDSGIVSIAALMAHTGKSRNTIKDWVDRHPDYERENGYVQQVSRCQKEG